MTCPRCQADNRDGARFCRECGATFAAVCPSCGAKVEAGSKFCDSCGAALAAAPPPPAAASRLASPELYTPKHLVEKILTSKAALEGERKQVTVLFADLKGSMELLADRDPEEARKLLDPVLEHMMEAVHRYEGTVNQVMGDGIMALFGAPLSHEDHAVRACYAALRMQESVKRYAEGVRRQHGIEVQIRVGMNSGEVVVRSIGSDLHMDYTAVGQTTHLAARMEQLATPGSIRLTAETLRLAEGYVEVKPLGPFPVKGLTEPVEVFELVGASPVRSRLQAAAARGLTKFVGRDGEMDTLFGALEQARQGRGQVAAIVGESGVGKSRLVWEFTHSHRSAGCLVLEAPSVSYGKSTTYLPVIELLKRYVGVEPRDDGRKIREKITGKLVSLDRALEPCLSPLLSLLDVPVEDEGWERLDPVIRRQHLHEAVRQVLLRESREQPLVVVFEDLHWIDGETQALLDGLIERLPTAHVCVLVNYRPEYRHAWGSKTYYTQVRLDALAPASAAELLDALIGGDDSVQPLVPVLIARTEGNPFFLEETVQSLVETDALVGERGAYRLARAPESLSIPATAQAILSARIDRLAPEDKRLLQIAAVVGKDVPYPLLQPIADMQESALRATLARLQEAEFLYEAQLFPELEYTFKHALTHEVAYGGLLRERRCALHARILDAMEQLHGERFGKHMERLAHHALRGELHEKAAHYLRQAGIKAVARSAPQDACGWFEQALDVLAVMPEDQSTLEQAFEIRLDLRAALTQLGEARRGLQPLREAEVLAERLGDELRRNRVCGTLANALTLLGDVDEAMTYAVRAWTIASAVGDLEAQIRSRMCLQQAHFFAGDYQRVVELAKENLAALPAGRAHEFFGQLAPASVYNRYWLSMSLIPLGQFAEASAHTAEALRLAEPMRHAYSIGVLYLSASVRHLWKGAWADAFLHLEKGISALRAGNIAILVPRMVASTAWALAQLGSPSEAVKRLSEARQLLDGLVARGMVGMYSGPAFFMARTCLLLGKLAEARELSHLALESSAGMVPDVWHLLGDIATHADAFDPERGEAHYRQALALAEPRSMRPLIAHCHLGLGKLYRRTGKSDRAQEYLATATTLYREMDMRFYLEQVEAELKRLG
jgi:class 3 adenylate cyclase/tetratricopeptide (TPR) repeat protein